MNTRRITTDFLNDPFLIGFDRMIERMRDTTPNQQAYPPYNIVKVDDDQYELQLAIAGGSPMTILIFRSKKGY